MSRLFLNVSLFFLGMALAFMFSYRSQVATALVSHSPRSSITVAQGRSAPRAESAAAGKSVKDYDALQHRLMERAVPEAERERALADALAEGSLESLQLIRTEYLSFLPNYHQQLLPVLKRHALDNLLLRFTENDWMSWPDSAVLADGGPTQARTYVDNISVVNAELGRFLETAAQLLHGLYLSTMSGEPYSVAEDMYAVIQNAERLLSHRRYTAVPARMLLDPTTVTDPVFLRVLEKMRASLWVLYGERFPNDIRTRLRLLQGISPEVQTSEFHDALRNLLYRLSLNGTRRLREEAAALLAKVTPLKSFYEKDDSLRQALAEFYVISAVDALEGNDFDAAQQLLDRSRAVQDGLEAQNVVKRFLDAPRAKPAQEARVAEPQPAPATKPQAVKEGAKQLFASTKPHSRRHLEQVVVIVVVLLAAGLLGTRFLFALIAKKTTRETSLPPIRSRREAPQPAPFADDDEIQFDDLEEFDDAVEKEVINR